ncbi:MAG: hypothetical protein K2Y21_09450 [Phycisphaerales bacterium]|nr:hypothetical protein [Phycisphaerales bacterium]
MIRSAANFVLALAATAGTALGQQVIEIPATGGTPAAPKPHPDRPAASGRLVRIYNFEERDTNPSPVPFHWTRFQDQDDRPRPGFPRYNVSELVELNDQPAASRGCVRLMTRGGSTALRLDPGVLPVFSDADYLIGARVRTEGLRNARAVIACRFLNETLEPIPASERISKPLLSEGRFTTVSINMPAEFSDARFLQIELLLLQQEMIASEGRGAPAPAPPGQLYIPDVSGAAYFDDVSIVQLPRLELSTQNPSNIYTAPDKPALELLVRDLTGESLTGTLTVLDASGRTIDTRPLRLGEGRSKSSWTPNLPGFGWYRAVLEMSNGTLRVGATAVDFVWLPPKESAASPDEFRFWVFSGELAPGVYPAMANAIRALRSTGMSVPVWTADLTPDAVSHRVDELRPLSDSFRNERLELGMSLPRIPVTIFGGKAGDVHDPWGLLTRQPASAAPLLDEFLDRYGPSVQRWQIGSFDGRSLFNRDSVASGAASIESLLGKLVPGPIVVAPATLEDATALGSLGRSSPFIDPAMYAPASALADSVGLAVSSWRRTGSAGFGRRATLALDTADKDELDAIDAANAIAKKLVRAWAASAPLSGPAPDQLRLALVDPWTIRPGNHPQLMPRPEVAAWRGMIDRLADREFVGTLPLPSGAEGYIFANRRPTDPNRGGLLVVWNDTTLPDRVELRNYLGPGTPWVADAFGNRSELTDPSHRPLPLSSTPLLIEGVDAELLRFGATISIDPPLLSMTQPESQHRLKITNPWPTTISGRLVLIEPGGGGGKGARDRSWRISPRLFPFSLAAGETAEFPLTVSFGPSEEIGTKAFIFDTDLTAIRAYDIFKVSTQMELGMKDLSFSVTATPRGDSVELEATVSNQTKSALTLELTAFPPGNPRQNVDIGEVLAGNQAIRRFSVPNIYPAKKGKKIAVTLSDAESSIRITRTVVIP